MRAAARDTRNTTFDCRDVESHPAARITGVDTHQHAGTASEGGGNATMLHEQIDVS